MSSRVEILSLSEVGGSAELMRLCKGSMTSEQLRKKLVYMTVIFTVHAMGAAISQTLAYIMSLHGSSPPLTEYLALTGILGHDVDHVFCLHHL